MIEASKPLFLKNTHLSLKQQPQLLNRVIDLNQIGDHVLTGPLGDSGCGLRTGLQWARGLTHPSGGLDGNPWAVGMSARRLEQRRARSFCFESSWQITSRKHLLDRVSPGHRTSQHSHDQD